MVEILTLAIPVSDVSPGQFKQFPLSASSSFHSVKNVSSLHWPSTAPGNPCLPYLHLLLGLTERILKRHNSLQVFYFTF